MIRVNAVGSLHFYSGQFQVVWFNLMVIWFMLQVRPQNKQFTIIKFFGGAQHHHALSKNLLVACNQAQHRTPQPVTFCAKSRTKTASLLRRCGRRYAPVIVKFRW